MAKKEMIGLRIRTMRKSRHMTQEDLARAISQSPSSITMYETGRREPDFETLEAIADVFNIPLAYLIVDSDTEPTEDQKSWNRFVDQKIFSQVPITPEARIISGGIDMMPPERREQALRILQAAFAEYSDFFKENENDDA